MTEVLVAQKGLEGLIADDSAISEVDTTVNRLYYRGYDIQDLCEKASFLEVAYLMLYGELPTRAQLSEFDQEERLSREIPPAVYDVLKKYRLIPTRWITFGSALQF